MLRSFAQRGEIPNPVPGTEYGKGCGYPVMILLPYSYRAPGQENPLIKATLLDPLGKLVEGTQSCPGHPANRAWPGNSSCAAFVPS